MEDRKHIDGELRSQLDEAVDALEWAMRHIDPPPTGRSLESRLEEDGISYDHRGKDFRGQYEQASSVLAKHGLVCPDCKGLYFRSWPLGIGRAMCPTCNGTGKKPRPT